MAASTFSRFLLTSKHTLTLVSRSYTSLASSSTSLSRSSILRYRPIVAVAAHFHRMSPATPIRTFATRPASAASDQNSNFSNKAPGETILLDGCDFEHWLVVMDKPEADATRDDIIDYYVKTMIEVVGSEEEARKKIYSVSTKHYFAFGANITEELSFKLKDIPGVRWVLPDSYLDVKNKDYGGEPFINGQAVPYDPKYHEEWVKNNARANERNKRSERSERPRNFDKSRNFDRRRENVRDNPANTDASQTSRSNVGGPTPYNQNLQQGGQPNYGGSPSYQPGVGPNQNSAGNPYQNQNVPGGDVPPPNLR